MYTQSCMPVRISVVSNRNTDQHYFTRIDKKRENKLWVMTITNQLAIYKFKTMGLMKGGLE